ncbi:uncharacterized protein PG998_006983 [Apiospora kogelbergensis]|uniref:uncharacterized protein n=1 Tax=Apiospora kogelbergensis TaxID=1337665 RepID=UPI00312F2ECA
MPTSHVALTRPLRRPAKQYVDCCRSQRGCGAGPAQRAEGANTKVIVVKIDSASRKDPFEAAKAVQAQNIDHIDVVISSAGIAKLNTIEDMPLEEFEEVLQVNTFSVMLLYKTFLALMRKAASPALPLSDQRAGAASLDPAKEQEYGEIRGITERGIGYQVQDHGYQIDRPATDRVGKGAPDNGG